MPMERSALIRYLDNLNEFFESDLKLLNNTAAEYLIALDNLLGKSSLEEKMNELYGEKWKNSLKNLIAEENDEKKKIDDSNRVKPKFERVIQYILDLKERENIISDHYDRDRYPNIHLLDIQIHQVNDLLKDGSDQS